MGNLMSKRNWAIAALSAGFVLMAAAACSGGAKEATEVPSASNGTGTGLSVPIVANGSGAAASAARGVPAAQQFAPDYGYAYQSGSFSTGIVVNGIGMRSVAPDIAKVYLGIEARDKTVSLAREAAAQAMTGVRDALKAAGVAEKDIVTTSFSVYPETIWVEVSDNIGKHSEPRIIGYIVSNSVEVTVRKIDDVGKVVDTAADKGGDLVRINSIQFTLADPNAQAADMRKLAAADAKAKAQLYADAMGVRLGQLLFLSEVSSSAPVLQKDLYSARAEAAAFAPTPITPGEIELSATITAVFAIAQ